MTEQQDHSRHSNGRGSTESFHEFSSKHNSKRNDNNSDNYASPQHDHALPELGGKKSSHSSPSTSNLLDNNNNNNSNQSPTYHPSPTPTLPLTNRQQLQLRSRNRDSPIPMRGAQSDMEQDGRVEIGLENLGNTCFMNSALQCLLHIQPLVAYFLDNRMERDLNPTSPKKGMLASSFNHLIQEVVDKRSGSAVAPTNFQRAVSVF